jgi:hypothetical protein
LGSDPQRSDGREGLDRSAERNEEVMVMRRLVVMVAMAVSVALPLESQALAGRDCELAQGSGQSQFDPVTGTFQGEFSFVVGGVPVSVSSSTEIVAEEFRGAIWFVTTSHRLTFPDDTALTTLDKARLVPTPEPGVFRAVSNLDVISGGSGFLVGVGTIDFSGLPTATWRLFTGQLCLS